MTWLYSRALAEAFSPESYTGGASCAPSRSISSVVGYCALDKTTEFSRLSRYGMTFEPFDQTIRNAPLCLRRYAQSLIGSSFPEASHVKTCPKPEPDTDSPGNARASGFKWRGSLAKYDPVSSKWKTRQICLLSDGDSTSWSENFPSWGMARHGELFPLPTSALHTFANAYGSGRKGRTYPTPTATQYKGWSPGHNRAASDDRLDYVVEREAFEAGTPGRTNPAWVEWLMGWPIGWTSPSPIDRTDVADWEVSVRYWWKIDGGFWRIPRTVPRAKDAVPRLMAIGNGQVPLCSFEAWEALGSARTAAEKVIDSFG